MSSLHLGGVLGEEEEHGCALHPHEIVEAFFYKLHPTVAKVRQGVSILIVKIGWII